MTITIDESERQVLLLAMAHLTVERPGWEFMLTEIAKKMDDIQRGKPWLYTEFLLRRRDQVSNSLPEVATEPLLKQALGL